MKNIAISLGYAGGPLDLYSSTHGRKGCFKKNGYFESIIVTFRNTNYFAYQSRPTSLGIYAKTFYITPVDFDYFVMNKSFGTNILFIIT